MADDKKGRDKQAQDADRRQREREIATELERGDEGEPVATTTLADVEAELEALSFPTTGTKVVAEIGEQAIESATESYRIEALIPETDTETFDSPAAVSVQVQRPAVAAAMKRVVEASASRPDTEFSWAQRKAYEYTLEELDSIGDDEGVLTVSNWIVDRIHERGTLPSSEAVRREAVAFCRANGYQIRDDEWLGI
jgi:hypothetical protein